MYIYDYTMKQYKPGQFVSLGGKIARVYRRSPTFSVCECCKEINGEYPCYKAPIQNECAAKLGWYYYPKFIKQCKKQEKL